MMAAERAPGSGRGRPGCDWEEAFAFWAALPNEQRTYAAVAAKFGVSVRTVERRGREGGWRERLQAINTSAAATTDLRIGEAKAKTVGQMLKLLEATLVAYAENVRHGQLRTAPADLERMFKLLHVLHAELETPTVRAGHTPALAAVRTVEHAAAVVQALAESGALEELGLQPITSDSAGDAGATTDSEIADADRAGDTDKAEETN